MKTIATLVLLALAGGAHAQTRLMQVNKTDGTTEEYRVPHIESVTFGEEEWEVYGTGTYTYNIYFANADGSTRVDEGLTVYRSRRHTDRYKIAGWGEGIDFFFTYDAATGAVAAAEQSTQVYDASFDEYVFVDDLIHQWGAYDQSRYLYGQLNAESYHSGEVFYFSLIYYLSVAYYGYTGDIYGDGYETLVMTSYGEGEIGAVESVMDINYYDNAYTQYDVSQVASITYGSDVWDEVGRGNYIFSDMAMYGYIEGCTVYQHSEDKTQWKVEFLTEGYPLAFTYDAATGAVSVAENDTGYTYSTYYGADNLWIYEADDWIEQYIGTGAPTGYHSYYDAATDTFYFAVAYYCPTLFIYFGYTGEVYEDDDGNYYTIDYEQLQLTSRYAAPSQTSVRRTTCGVNEGRRQSVPKVR